MKITTIKITNVCHYCIQGLKVIIKYNTETVQKVYKSAYYKDNILSKINNVHLGVFYKYMYMYDQLWSSQQPYEKWTMINQWDSTI